MICWLHLQQISSEIARRGCNRAGPQAVSRSFGASPLDYGSRCLSGEITAIVPPLPSYFLRCGIAKHCSVRCELGNFRVAMLQSDARPAAEKFGIEKVALAVGWSMGA